MPLTFESNGIDVGNRSGRHITLQSHAENRAQIADETKTRVMAPETAH
jgi:hypothetical protein